ncbi:MAG: ABC transporter permease [Deltaproteobacteria bacterium]|nr:ABC transporter permease [Deltaproteobacteria bacterium]
MIKLLYTLKKEFLLMTRDVHAVAVLFVMPAVFIMIMSLAMRDLFEQHNTVHIDVLAVSRDGGKAAQAFLKAMEDLPAFKFHLIEKEVATEQVQEQMLALDYKFALLIGENFSAFVDDKEKGKHQKPLALFVNPSVNRQTQMILTSALEGRLAKLRKDALVDRLGQLLTAAGMDAKQFKAPEEDQVEVRYAYKGTAQASAPPSAVQQSVPAWLVFSMFFIVIPISNTFISERGQGTLMRLKSMNVSRFSLILGKMIPYLFVNALQVLLMIAIGVYAVPHLGGTSLTVGDSLGGLILIAGSVSFSAISVALLIASLARTTEQATTIGGVLNIIFAALGGIMVPKFVMPGFMQEIARLSPLSWGLEGFLDIFLRHGTVSDVLPESLSLLLFGAVMLTWTIIALKKQRGV